MATRGFIGFKTENELYGIYNRSDSYYEYLGKEILNIYINSTGSELNKIFNNITWNNNKNISHNFSEVFSNSDIRTIGNRKDFLYDGLYCEYGYVFNLDNDTLELYRGFFKEKQYLDSHNQHYTHLVYEVNRNSDFDKLKLLFSNEHSISEYFYDTKYFEKAFMKSDDIDEIIRYEY